MAKATWAAVALAAAITTAAGAMAAQPMKADNTGINQRDRNKAEVTAQQQGSSKSDREATRLVRKSILANKSLSTYAHNIKIVTRAGEVTLKGPVRSDGERQAVLGAAQSAAQGRKIIDEMSVVPKTK